MNDPHVEVLAYAFSAVDTRHDYSNAGAWQGELGGFDCRLDGGRLEARPKDHYPNTDNARQALEAHLHSWELWSELEYGIRIEFRFDSARVVDRQPEPGSVAIHAQVVGVVVATGDVTVKVGHGEYPQPSPTALASSALVDELLGWVRDVRTGQHRLLVIAYLFFTRLSYEYGDEKRAAAALKVSRELLTTLRKLAAKNDPTERRKVEGPIDPLTEAEKQWIRTALPKLTQQVSEIAAGSQPTQLTMADLPPDR